MARAKRTDRTDARRRYRAEQAALADGEPGTEAAEARGQGSKPQVAGKPAPQPRPSIMASLRGASRPLDLKGDLRAAPQVFTNWGFLVAVGATLALATWFVLAYNDAMAAIPVGTATEDQLTAVVGANTLPYFLGTLALQPPPAIGAFLIGFAAKRASWMGGLVYGIFVSLLAIVILQTPSGRLLTADGSSDAILLGHAIWSPVGAALFASAAAWYRRFLDLANPNRAAQRQARAQQGRGNAKAKPAR